MKNIYAAGDINGILAAGALTSRQGEIAAENIMGASRTFDETSKPKCIHTWPGGGLG